MNLNKEQEQVCNTIVDWYNKPVFKNEDYFFTLAGFAGTGKSTTVDYILRNISHRVVVSAPTHKAKRVIQDKTNKAGETIQGLLGLRPDMDIKDFNPNKPQFNVKAEERIQLYKFIIIDECSMLQASIVKLIQEKAIKHKVKVLFVGDEFQLPPVKEKVSKCFLLPNVVKLETIVRQDYSNPNTRLIELARNDVRDNTNTLARFLSTVKQDMNGDEGFSSLPQDKFYKELLNYYYNSEYKYNSDFAKTICWENTTVGAINRYIRKHLTDYKDLIAVGDMLMGYNNISIQIEGPPFYIPVIANSEDYIVESAELIEMPIEGNIYTGYYTKLRMQYEPLFILHPSSYEAFTKEILVKRRNADEYKAWPAYYRFKNKIHLMHNIMNPYDRTKVLVSKDIDYGYAITVHKSQGSTYNNVGTILKDLNNNPKLRERNQLKYVALSRTSKVNLIY